MADAPAALDQAERAVTRAVTVALDATAVEFARAVTSATSLTAASFSVGRIASMWGRRIPALVRRFLGVVETAAEDTAESVQDAPPDGWDDLPGRYDEGRELPPSIGTYVTVTEHLLRAVGDRLADVAREELSEGLNAGETTAQLKARLRRAFNREGAQLGPTRAELIAATETTRAWNTGTLAVAQALTGPERPLVKQWLTRRDPKVRSAHANVNGQLRLLDEAFTVAGIPMDAPGDPTAPPELVCNCRCYLAVAVASRTATASPLSRPAESQEPFGAVSKNPRKGPFVMPETETVTAAADGSHLQGAMIALMPTAEDAQRLAIEGGEDVEQLHLTLWFLGDDGNDWTEDQRRELIGDVRALAASELPGPITGRAFGAAHWNAGGDSPSWVWSVGDDRDRPDDAPTLADAHAVATYALENSHERPDVPTQHSPWAAHICAAYSDEAGLLPELEQRLGPVTFDRIRVTFAGDATDIPLGPAPAMAAPAAATAAGLEARGWTTPDDTALAYENEETGDGRIFAAGALYWDGTGPWPLQYADEMLSGHEGAELAGSIQTMDRDGDRLDGTGVLYPGRPAGADAVLLLEEGAPLGVSVDLDAVSIEFVDRTMPEGDEEPVEVVYASASVDQLSVMRMDDGSWMLRTTGKGEWTASTGGGLALAGHTALLITSTDGRLSAGQITTAFPTAALTAAAGDADDPDRGTVVHSESAGDLLVRITRGRVRGATLVAMPAYDRARIVLDPWTPPEPSDEETAAAIFNTLRANGVSLDPLIRVISYVSTSPLPVGAREVACRLQMSMQEAHKHLARATQDGRLVRLARGVYVAASTHPEGVTAVTAGGEQGPEPLTELQASAWSAIREADPMPAAWFREPTAEELPPGSGGVHYANGRIYGWVAQAGVPHAGHPGRNLTIESLGQLDLTHFLRARFTLDDGTSIRAGAMTMDVGHHRDGAECETESCQFDDTRTVAGVVTVGTNAGGLWFSGAAAPHLSDWSRTVFTACQPSYHMRQGRGGRWELRAVLSVPVPGHSSPLVAAVVEQANLALTASAAPTPAAPGTGSDTGLMYQGAPLTDEHFDAFTAALLDSPEFIGRFLAAVESRAEERARVRQEIAELATLLRPSDAPDAPADGRDLAAGLAEAFAPLREMAASLAGPAHPGRN
ncbi:phage minor head protein [Streptomyces sp. NPDC001552]|uniref:phage minor head protein n=1 Tax=Streptomyces sp. NPDC001552 TaxID=3364587 RepID=UPI0036741A9B